MEFILLYPYKILNSALGTATIKLIHQHVNSNKTLENCRKKMDYLKSHYPNLDDMVSYLIKVTQVSQKWIEERKYTKIQGGIIQDPDVKEIMDMS